MPELRRLHLPLPHVLLLQHYRRAGDQQGRAHKELGFVHVPPLHAGGERPQPAARKAPEAQATGWATSSSSIRRNTAEPRCTGCGRCIRHCPVSMDIGRIVALLSDGGDEAPKKGMKELQTMAKNPYLPDLATIIEIIEETPNYQDPSGCILNDAEKMRQFQVRARPGGPAFGLRRGGIDLRHQFSAHPHGVSPVQRDEGRRGNRRDPRSQRGRPDRRAGAPRATGSPTKR